MDPNIISTALKTIPLALNVVGSQIQKKKDQKMGDYLISQAEKTPMYQMSGAYDKYLAMAKQDPLGDFMRQQAAANQATSIGALKSGGAKSIMGGLGNVQQQSFADQAGIAGRSAQNLQNAMLTYGQAEQGIMNRNVGQKEKRLDAITQAEVYKKEAKDAARQALFAAGEQAATLGAGLYDKMKGLSKPDGTTAGGITGGGNADVAEILRRLGVNGLDDQSIMGKTFFGKNGGRIEKTPGQFSHQNNPIDIVRKGKKIGEMTGGEYVLNPAQAAKIQSLAGAQKKEALARYVNGLFKQFNNK
jgi:hypothetical protein